MPYLIFINICTFSDLAIAALFTGPFPQASSHRLHKIIQIILQSVRQLTDM